jgi:hypothetical protein
VGVRDREKQMQILLPPGRDQDDTAGNRIAADGYQHVCQRLRDAIRMGSIASVTIGPGIVNRL